MQRATILRSPPGRASHPGTGRAVAIGHRRQDVPPTPERALSDARALDFKKTPLC